MSAYFCPLCGTATRTILDERVKTVKCCGCNTTSTFFEYDETQQVVQDRNLTHCRSCLKPFPEIETVCYLIVETNERVCRSCSGAHYVAFK